MSLELVILGIILMAICAGFVTLFLRAFYQKKFTNALIFKGIASLCFVIFGGVSCFTNELTPSTVIVFIGLCFGIFGDEIIALCQVFPEHDTKAFIGGGSLFLVGHVLYIASLFLLGKISWIALILSAVLIVALGGLYEKHRKFLSGDMKAPLTIYLGIVVFVTALAIGVFAKQGLLGAGLIALGGALFTVSDNILFAYKLGENSKFRQNIALHVAYYLAQFVIAWGMACL